MHSPWRVTWALLILSFTIISGPRVVGGAAEADDAPAVLVSRQLGESLGLATGDLIQLSSDPSGAGARPFRVAGTYEPVPDPMRFSTARLEVRLHLPDLIGLTADPGDPLAAESVSAINVALVHPDEANDFSRDLAAQVPGLLVAPTTPPDEDNPFIVLERFHLAIAIVTIAASTVFLLALMVLLVHERRQVVGILRLIGLRRRRILAQVLVEGLVVAAVGTLFGLLLAFAAQAPINHFFQWRYDTALVFVRITPEIAWRCLALALPLGVLASLAASWTVLRRDVLVLTRR